MPIKYTDDFIQDLNKKLEYYIENTDIPIVSEFAYQNNMARQKLYEFPVINDTIKILISKKEAQLERKALNNEINTTMVIFSLKQLGWKDRHEVDQNQNIDLSEFAKLIRNNVKIQKPNEPEN